MAKDTFFINLDDNGIKPPIPMILNSTIVNTDPLNETSYIYKIFTDDTPYDYFLYNPTNSGKIIKIKSLNLNEIPSSKVNIAAGNILLQLGTSVISSSQGITYIKLDTNSPDLPSGISFDDNISTYTSAGTFRAKPGYGFTTNPLTGVSLRANFPAARALNSPNLYNNSNISNNVQYITLNSGENLVIGFSSATVRTPIFYQLNATITSGSNTYFYSETLNNALTNPHIGVFTNNSGTTIKISDISLSVLGFSSLYNYGSNSSFTSANNERIYHTAKLTKDILGDSPFSGLDNLPDSASICSMDTNISISNGIVCYKNALPPKGTLGTRVRYPGVLTYNSQLTSLNHLRLRFEFGQITSRGGGIELVFNQNDNRENKLDYKNSEIVINPGEAYGILRVDSDSAGVGGGGTDSIGTGHLLFTVENTTSTVVETGFGY